MTIKKGLSLLTLATAVVLVGIGVTRTFFQDTETSTGNKFVAGKFNLKIASQCTYNGEVKADCNWLTPTDLTNELFFNFNDVKPGDYGENTLSLKIDNNPAWVCAELYNVKNFDNGCEKPENLIDTTCGDPGEGQGELQNNLFFTIWKDTNCNNLLDPGETKIVDNTTASSAIWPIADSTQGSPLPGGTTACYGLSWTVPLATSNIIQSDSVAGDIKFTAVQSRHMDNFTCSGLYPEVCDGLDNNYNGQVDENDPGGGGACSTGQLGVCSAGTLHCQNGALQCVQNIQSSPETCDGLDNDCDGAVDENDPGGGGACNTGQQGTCSPGTLHCQSGALHCVQNVSSSPEVCNGLDDNCNGVVDEGDPGGGGACSTGLLGVCSTGTRHCQGGALVCTQSVSSSPEVCDGLDNNCNGTVDENPASLCGNDGLYCNGTESCVASACTHSGNPCPGPNGNNNCSESCNETADNCTAADPDGSACSLLNGNGSCSGGTCSNLVSCVVNYGNCDGNPYNGCETNLATDAYHCGTCGNSCSTNHDIAACVSSQCQIICNANYANCNLNVSDGCEIDLRSNNSNCGTCAHACAGGQTCIASVCTP